jgi:rubredoxin
MEKYRCSECGYVYDPALGDEASGVPPGTSFDELIEEWPCPGCGHANKLDFFPLESAYPPA